MRRRSALTDAAYAVLTEPETEPDFVFPVDPAGKFLRNVLDALGDLAAFCTFDLTGEPRIELATSTGRRYGVTLPTGEGPYEIWAYTSLPADDPSRRFLKLREREEVLAQALHTHRLAWHRLEAAGWIGMPVGLAANLEELDVQLAEETADALRRLFFTVERICYALDERASARTTRQQDTAVPALRVPLDTLEAQQAAM